MKLLSLKRANRSAHIRQSASDSGRTKKAIFKSAYNFIGGMSVYDNDAISNTAINTMIRYGT